MSAIREGIEAVRRPKRRRKGAGASPPQSRRGGIFDLMLVLCVCWFAAGRTPVGGLVGYGLEVARGHEAELPTLTAWFDSGAAPPNLEELAVHTPSPVPPGGVPEPFRTAARTVLADPPAHLDQAMRTRTDLAETDRAVLMLDELYDGDEEAALELLVIPADLRERAITRSRAAGDPEPERYAQHRVYLPAHHRRDGDRVVTGTLALASALDLQWPVRTPHRVSSHFGMRFHPVYKKTMLHNGIDLAVPVGTPLYAPQDGEVTVVNEDSRNGRYVVIQHAHGHPTTTK